MTKKNEKGSVFILVLIGILVISLLGVSGLTKSTTEMSISKNFNSDKNSLLTADSGINYGINELRNTFDPQSVNFSVTQGNGHDSFWSGLLSNSDKGNPQNVEALTSFSPPFPPGISLDEDSGISITAWNLAVSSNTRGNARKEIQTAVVTLSTGY